MQRKMPLDLHKNWIYYYEDYMEGETVTLEELKKNTKIVSQFRIIKSNYNRRKQDLIFIKVLNLNSCYLSNLIVLKY